METDAIDLTDAWAEARAVVAGHTPRLAYRCWRIQGDRLAAPVRFNEPWPPGLVTATCGRGECWGFAQCTCGLYGVDPTRSRHRDVYFDLETGRISRGTTAEIIGAIWLFDVQELEADHAFVRGRYAAVAGLLTPAEDPDRARSIAERYDVPLLDTVAELAEAAQAHPLAAVPIPAPVERRRWRWGRRRDRR